MTEALRSARLTRDARGRTVRMLDPVALQVLHRYEVIEAPALHAIVENMEPGTAQVRRYGILIAAAVVVLVVGGIGAMYYLAGPADRADLLSALKNPGIYMPGIIGGVIAPWIAVRQERMKRVRSAMLRHCRCPHCGYNLRGSPVEQTDGTVTCSECGCAWLMGNGSRCEDTAGNGHPAQQRASRALIALALGLILLASLGVLICLKIL